MYILSLDPSLESSKMGFTKPELAPNGLRVSRPFSITSDKRRGPLVLQTQNLSVLDSAPEKTSLDLTASPGFDRLVSATSEFFETHSSAMFGSRTFSRDTVRSRMVLDQVDSFVLGDTPVLDQYDNPVSLAIGDSVRAVLVFESLVFSKTNLTPEFKLLFVRKEAPLELPDFKSLLAEKPEPQMEYDMPLPEVTASELDFFS